MGKLLNDPAGEFHRNQIDLLIGMEENELFLEEFESAYCDLGREIDLKSIVSGTGGKYKLINSFAGAISGHDIEEYCGIQKEA